VSARRCVAAVGLGAALLAPRSGLAQGSQPQLSAKASASQVEVGEPFSVELKVAIEQGSIADPELRVPTGFSVVGQSSIQFGSRGKRSVNVTWQLVAQRAGHFSIAGPSVTWNNRRFSTSPIPIEVVAGSGRAPKRPGINSPFSNPFLGPGLQIPWQFGEEEPDDEPDGREAPDLNLPSGPDNWIFLRAVADKKSAVVGEQVTLSFYIYHKPAFRREAARDAPLVDFRHVPLLTNPGSEPDRRAKVGKDWFHVQLLDKVAAFPLREGALHTGSLWVRLFAPRLGPYNERETEDLVINVTEPPRQGKPPGYRSGDVGQFSLTATVQPRQIEQGSAAAVSIKVSGSGNFPESLRVPERTGVEWLDPEKKDAIGPQAGVVSGFRSFGYVVRVKESGKVPLGSVELPYWDPATKKYEVARVDLGALDVNPVTKVVDPKAPLPEPDPVAANPFAALGGPRMALGAFAAPRAPRWGEGQLLWLLIGAPPLLVGLRFAALSSARRLRARRASVRESPSALAAQAIRAAEEAEASGDRKALAGAIERALHLAIEAATGLKSRGVLLADLPDELSAQGISRELGEEIQAALAACESLRFEPVSEGAPQGSAAPSAGGSAGELSARGRRLVSELQRIKAP
jgi:hypothetical protein